MVLVKSNQAMNTLTLNLSILLLLVQVTFFLFGQVMHFSKNIWGEKEFTLSLTIDYIILRYAWEEWNDSIDLKIKGIGGGKKN
jgi:hypothetical protein